MFVGCFYFTSFLLLIIFFKKNLQKYLENMIVVSTFAPAFERGARCKA